MADSGGGPNAVNYADATNKGCSVEMLHSSQSWIADSNAVWSGNGVRRYARGIVRWPLLWTGTKIQFDAVCTPLAFSDGQFAVMVDGALVATVTVPGDSIPRNYVVSITPAGGGSTVEVWEPQNGKPSTQNTGADGPVEGGNVTAVYLPTGQTLTRPTATTAIIGIGDSILGFRLPIASNAPISYWGPTGQLRALAHANGWLWGSLDYGGACMLGDGLTAANFVTWIGQMVTAMGSPTTVKLLYLPFHNDYADNGSSVSTTPSQGTTWLQAIINAFPSYQHVAITPLPAASSGAVNGFTLAQWRTATAAVTGATILDSTTFGINTATDLSDGTHLNTAGVVKFVAAVRASVGL
jgi:hypothetical protein